MFVVILRSFGEFAVWPTLYLDKVCYSSKTGNICGLGINNYSTLGNFHCKGFAAILRSCGANFGNFVSRNWLVVEQTTLQFGILGELVAHLCSAFDVLVFSVMLAPFSAPVSNTH